MRRAQFAELIGVSKQQVSKYAGKGYVVLDGDLVDVDASLVQLEGHLDEAKRQRALQVRAMASGARVVREPQPAAQRSPKAEREEIETALKRLDLAKATGEVVYVADVDAAARKAVQDLRDRAGQSHQEAADRICSTFGLAPEKSVPLARMLRAEFEQLMGLFAADMAVLADADARRADETPANAPEAAETGASAG